MAWVQHLFFSSKEGRERKLLTRLLLALVPSAVVILITAGVVTYYISAEYISMALERFSRLHATTSAHAVGSALESSRQDLLHAARQPRTPGSMRGYLNDLRESRGSVYFEFGYVALSTGGHVIYVSDGLEHVQIPAVMASEIRPSPLHLYEEVKALRKGDVLLKSAVEVDYPFPLEANPHNRISLSVIRMVTPSFSDEGELLGYFYLAIDSRSIRDILSLYDSERSPVFAVPRNPQLVRYSYMFDREGWVLFQSEPGEQNHLPISTLAVRQYKQGTLGRPGLKTAFMPASSETRYWGMVEEVTQRRAGLIQFKDRTAFLDPEEGYTLAFAPVRFTASPDRPQEIVGGVAFVDRSMLTVVAGYRHFDAMLLIVVSAALVTVLLIVLVSHGNARDLMSLARSVETMHSNGRLEEIQIRPRSYEARVLKDAVNAMTSTIKEQLEDIRLKELAIESVSLQEPATLTEEWKVPQAGGDPFPEIVGTGPLIEQHKRDILKAGQVDVDILIVGETGTGKQLAAEAIHRISRRSQRPFISVNCGELDENLLLSTLFGHVKGAFTDGKADRKGAFLQAHGGTLFLDEIQTASPKVQQALLRAISVRKIKPLGSDRELSVDFRLITATNADLNLLIQRQEFREDLYYRLKVITISPPPLREHRENIPILAGYFLKEAERMAGRQGLAFSKGFLDKLMQYDWPGNIRELKNSIIKSAVMAEGSIIQRDQLRIEPHSWEVQHPMPPRPAAGPAQPEEIRVPLELNQRQALAFRYVREHGRINRQTYQSLLGTDVSRRTAIYDLQDMVARGYLIKVGQGPTTSYVSEKRGRE
jgi:DNA-binding NtrC family response regulator